MRARESETEQKKTYSSSNNNANTLSHNVYMALELLKQFMTTCALPRSLTPRVAVVCI